jgi:hypothetical protein
MFQPAGQGGGQGTLPNAIDQAGDVTGYYIDRYLVLHSGYSLRRPITSPAKMAISAASVASVPTIR